MAEWTVIIKNVSGSDQWLTDFGTIVLSGGQVNLTEIATYDEIGGSRDLKDKITNDIFIVNDGTTDLDKDSSMDFVTLENLDDLYENFYTQTQLASAGAAEVEWLNITNAPTFGSPYWIEPVEVIALDVASVPVTAGAANGDFIVDTDDDIIYQLLGGTWTPHLTGGEGTRVINLTDSNESVWELLSGTWTDTETPSASMAVLVNDDGDGKQAQYVYNDDTQSWVKIADVDWDTSTINDNITFLSGAIDDNSSAISTNAGNISTNTGNISTNTGDILNLQTDVTSLSAAVDANTSDIATNAGDIITNAGDITNLQTDVTVLSGAIDTNATDIDNLETDLTALSAAIDVNAGDIDSIEIDVTNLGLDVAFLSGSIDDNYTEHIALSAGIDENATDVEALSAAIDNIPAATPHNTLGMAYNQGGSGAGRSISVDSGSVQLSAASGGYAPLELTPQASAPTQGLGAGQMSVINGLLCVYDDTRSKWLSVQRVFVAFGKNGNAKDSYLKYYGGGATSNLSGIRLARNATVVSMAGQLDVSNTATFWLRKNDILTDIVGSDLSINGLGNSDTTIDVDLNADDYLQCWFDKIGGGNAKTPMVTMEIAWRF